MYRTTLKEDQMSDFNLNCEHFLATSRQHFFASDAASADRQGIPEGDSTGYCGDKEHGGHPGR
ncbi:hypothetical protein [Candidatus Accumulibacter vicinus]|uniref:Uncharacterized protein n=1 Tax=Candidatus Accumulibacter vicinus TaxID=2954382 RepID=A0A084XX33_9PROT|nr:hypothetical protein [Candidatus Accumulibacter vicinus]KFB67027.1 MAG: hypothetical protein CAPSK01_003640 [Candidatus Accumulibacter vicinus]